MCIRKITTIYGISHCVSHKWKCFSYSNLLSSLMLFAFALYHWIALPFTSYNTIPHLIQWVKKIFFTRAIVIFDIYSWFVTWQNISRIRMNNNIQRNKMCAKKKKRKKNVLIWIRKYSCENKFTLRNFQETKRVNWTQSNQWKIEIKAKITK